MELINKTLLHTDCLPPRPGDEDQRPGHADSDRGKQDRHRQGARQGRGGECTLVQGVQKKL